MKAQSFPSAEVVNRFFHRVGWGLRWQDCAWLLPLVVVYGMLRWPSSRIEHITAALIAVGVLAWAIRRPGSALIALVVFVPLQAIGFGLLLTLHVPARLLRPAGGLKELVAVGILISALHALRVRRTDLGERSQLDSIDKALLAYVAVVTLYLIIPQLFTLGPVSSRWSVRLLAWRADCGYVLLFFAVRHAPIPASTIRRFTRALIGLTVVTVTLGFYQWLRPADWSHLVLVTGRQLQYQLSVLGNDLTSVVRNLGYVITTTPLRISSVFLSPFDMADFLLIPLALVLERITGGHRTGGAYVLGGAIVAALFASRVRADALAAVILVVVALAPTPNRPVAARLRLFTAVLLTAAIVIPSLGGTRFVNAQGGAKSSQTHVSELSGGLTVFAHHPLGLGIGNVAGVGDRFVLGPRHQGAFTVDNSVVQIADELGVQALAPWLVTVVLIWMALGRAAHRPDAFAGGVRLAFLAVLVAGMYHHVFLSLGVAWVLWAAMGLALRPESGPAAEQPMLASSSRSRMESWSCRHPPRLRLLFVALTVAAGLAGGYRATNQFPSYTSRSSIYVRLSQTGHPGQPSAMNIVQLDRTIAGYAAAVRTTAVVEGAIHSSGAARTTGDVIGETRADVIANTNLIVVSVADRDSAVAQSLANGVADSLITAVESRNGSVVASQADTLSLSVFQRASVGTLLPTNLKHNIILGMLFGFVASIALFLLVDYLDISVISRGRLRGGDDDVLAVSANLPTARP